ncbi:MAG: hypothetical protein SXQ77_11380, partial [Halobacteria archaeon]|nr:hypothetical protein [Halobacteria archaeon]
KKIPYYRQLVSVLLGMGGIYLILTRGMGVIYVLLVLLTPVGIAEIVYDQWKTRTDRKGADA